jgi:hypothetical protein
MALAALKVGLARSAPEHYSECPIQRSPKVIMPVAWVHRYALAEPVAFDSPCHYLLACS